MIVEPESFFESLEEYTDEYQHDMWLQVSYRAESAPSLNPLPPTPHDPQSTPIHPPSNIVPFRSTLHESAPSTHPSSLHTRPSKLHTPPSSPDDPTLHIPPSSPTPPLRLHLSPLHFLPNLPQRRAYAERANFLDMRSADELSKNVLVRSHVSRYRPRTDSSPSDPHSQNDPNDPNDPASILTARLSATSLQYDPHVMFACPFFLVQYEDEDPRHLRSHDPDAAPPIRALPIGAPNLPAGWTFYRKNVYLALWSSPESASHSRVAGWYRLLPRGASRYDLRIEHPDMVRPPTRLPDGKKRRKRTQAYARSTSARGARLVALGMYDRTFLHYDPQETASVRAELRGGDPEDNVLLDRADIIREASASEAELDDPKLAIEIMETYSRLLFSPPPAPGSKNPPIPLHPPSYEFDPDSGLFAVLELSEEFTPFFESFPLSNRHGRMDAKQRRRLMMQKPRRKKLAVTHINVMKSGAVRVVPTMRLLNHVTPSGFSPEEVAISCRRRSQTAHSVTYELVPRTDRDPQCMSGLPIGQTMLPAEFRDAWKPGKHLLEEAPVLVLSPDDDPTTRRNRSLLLTFRNSPLADEGRDGVLSVDETQIHVEISE